MTYSSEAHKAWQKARRAKQNESVRAWRSTHPGAVFGYYLRTSFGIDLEDYARLINTQNLKCAACSEPLDLKLAQKVHLDHCHKSGRVRGVLCSGCNKALGMLKESAVRLRALASYIEHWTGK